MLVVILEYLSTRDKLNLQTTCETFRQILKKNKKTNREVCKTLQDVTLPTSLMYSISWSQRFASVRELDLTSCYWLKSVEVRRCVFKLSNLEALYASGTFLSISDLTKILRALHQLKRLSFSLKPVSVRDVGSTSVHTTRNSLRPMQCESKLWSAVISHLLKETVFTYTRRNSRLWRTSITNRYRFQWKWKPLWLV